MISAVVFDIGGVLEWTPDTGLAGRWERRWGLPSGELDARLQSFWEAGEVGTMSEAQVYAAVRRRLGISAAEMEAFWEDVWADYLGTANTELLRYAAELRSRCKTALLSNSFVGAREREQARYGLGDLTETIVYSHEVGMTKPDPRIYQLVCSRLEVRPSDVAFVDDSPFAVEGAEAVGMTGLLFEGNAQVIAAIEALLEG